MNAIVASARGARLVEITDPTPSAGDCLVRVTAALLTPADLRHSVSVEGTNSASTIALGESFVGIVEAIADNDTSTRDIRQLIGQRVVVHPIVRCGRCERCLAGLGAHCESRAVLGVHRPGGIAERVVVPTANLVAIPSSLDDERAVFAVTVASALEAMRHVRVEGKAYISVLGDDLVALVTAQVMARLNVAVRVIAREATTLAAAEKLGVKHRHADEVGRRGDQHVVVDSTGSPESLDLAMRLARPRATILLLAAVGAVNLLPLVEGELRIHGCGHGPLAEAVGLLASRGVEVVSLIERRVALTALADAFAERRTGVLVRT